MLVKEIVPTEQVVDILCDVCGRSTKRILEPTNTARYRRILAMVPVTMVNVTRCICVKCVFRYTRNNEGDASREHMFDDDYEAANPDTFGRDYSNRR